MADVLTMKEKMGYPAGRKVIVSWAYFGEESEDKR